MNIQEIKIIEVLEKITKNGYQEFENFRKHIVGFCDTCIIDCHRLMVRMEYEIKYLDKDEMFICKTVVENVLDLIKSERIVAKYRMEKPSIEPLGTWTDKKIELIELLKCIQPSIDQGRISFISIQNAFEPLLNIKLGNVHSRFANEIETRKKENTGFIKKLQRRYDTLIEEYR